MSRVMLQKTIFYVLEIFVLSKVERIDCSIDRLFAHAGTPYCDLNTDSSIDRCVRKKVGSELEFFFVFRSLSFFFLNSILLTHSIKRTILIELETIAAKCRDYVPFLKVNESWERRERRVRSRGRGTRF